jgi:hypothetical protein
MSAFCSRNARPRKALVRRPQSGQTWVSVQRRSSGQDRKEGMEADDLLCSRNAQSRTPLVGRAH